MARSQHPLLENPVPAPVVFELYSIIGCILHIHVYGYTCIIGIPRYPSFLGSVLVVTLVAHKSWKVRIDPGSNPREAISISFGVDCYQYI